MRNTRLLVHGLLALTATFANAVPPASNVDVARCLPLKDSLKRLDCYDAIARRVLSPKDQRAAEEAERTQADAVAKQGERDAAEAKRRADAAAKEASRRATVAAATTALDGVRRLRSVVQSGVSYRDYRPAVAEAAYQVDRFVASAESQVVADFTLKLRTALSHYQTALSVWDVRFRDGRPQRTFARFEEPALYDLIVQQHQGMLSAMSNAGTGLLYEEALPIIWRDAASAMAESETLLNSYRN